MLTLEEEMRKGEEGNPRIYHKEDPEVALSDNKVKDGGDLCIGEGRCQAG